MVEGVRSLPQHFATLEADSVHDEMRVDMFPVNVRGDQHLALRPRPRCESFRQSVRLLTGDGFVR